MFVLWEYCNGSLGDTRETAWGSQAMSRLLGSGKDLASWVRMRIKHPELCDSEERQRKARTGLAGAHFAGSPARLFVLSGGFLILNSAAMGLPGPTRLPYNFLSTLKEK